MNFHFGFQYLVKIFECPLKGQGGLLRGFNPPQPSSSLATKWHPSSVFGCVRRVLWRREYGKRFPWLDGQVSFCFLPRWGWLASACLHAVLSQNSAQAVACFFLSLSSVPWYHALVDNPSA